MRKRIFRQMCVLILMTVFLSMALVSFVFYRQLSEDMHRELSNGIAYIEAGLVREGIPYLSSIEGQDKDSRITLIAATGEVLFDSQVVLSELDNHKDRPEVQAAIERGIGEAVRMSDTIGSQTYYYAKRMDDGTVLRVSSTTDNVLTAFMKSIPWVIGIVTFVVCLAMILARHQTRKLVEPINAIDLENPTGKEIYDELSPLLLRIHRQNIRIADQIKELTGKQEEFTSITDNMEEGLVLLDRNGGILSVTRSALRLLGSDVPNPVGKHISNLNRDLRIQKVVENALSGIQAEETFSSAQALLHLRANPVTVDGRINGAVLLLLDVTEQQKAEKLRREFSANVSHELKTPLTAISGFAELIRDGMAGPDDARVFAGKIYEEAARLLALINDIMRLSQLDENDVPLAKEETDLYASAQAVTGRLGVFAAEKGVTLTLEGESAAVFGVPRLLDELLYNLCENAIKYNKENGRVKVSVGVEDGKAVLHVCDTGIGIPEQDLDRIFERFYRVDKSHSKATGGTGLGLSIAKHIVSYHGGELGIKSVLGEGTEITVRFGKN